MRGEARVTQLGGDQFGVLQFVIDDQHVHGQRTSGSCAVAVRRDVSCGRS
jgi:hypothetical protein